MTEDSSSLTNISDSKRELQKEADLLARDRSKWIQRNHYFYERDTAYMRFLIPEGMRVLDIGCGNGRLLAALNPSRGVGVDFSRNMIDVARCDHPGLEFIVGDCEDAKTLANIEGTFDFIVLSDLIGALDDCEETFRNLASLCTRETRIVIAYYSHLWEPLLKIGSWVGLKMPQREQNWFSTSDIAALLDLADFDLIKTEWRQIFPRSGLGLGFLLNNTLANLPGIRRMCLRNYTVARARGAMGLGAPSTSVIIPCRNEYGNIAPAIERLPRFCGNLEVIFVEGHSQDGTFEEAERVRDANPDWDITVVRQDGVGKGDAVRKGFGLAKHDILMILDADLTVPPEDLPKFYRAIASGKGEFVNGTRLIYLMEDTAMRFLNYWANRTFAAIFSFLLNERFTDTLCGTKVLTRENYRRIEANRSFFGDFDPFGDFDLIFGAAKLNLKIVEVPIRYLGRQYGATQISRFSHGWLLLRMVWVAFKRLKNV